MRRTSWPLAAALLALALLAAAASAQNPWGPGGPVVRTEPLLHPYTPPKYEAPKLPSRSWSTYLVAAIGTSIAALFRGLSRKEDERP
jgi:hypothetical protein